MKRVFVFALTLILFANPAAAEKYDYARYWLTAGHIGKCMYFDGYSDGHDSGEAAIYFWLYENDANYKYQKGNKYKSLTQHIMKTHIKSERELTIATMDYLYQDPANKYIPWSNMIAVALKKIDGINIEEDLATYRKFWKEHN